MVILKFEKLDCLDLLFQTSLTADTAALLKLYKKESKPPILLHIFGKARNPKEVLLTR